MMLKIAFVALLVAVAHADYYARRSDNSPYRLTQSDFFEQRQQLPELWERDAFDWGERAVECTSNSQCKGARYCWNNNCV